MTVSRGVGSAALITVQISMPVKTQINHYQENRCGGRLTCLSYLIAFDDIEGDIPIDIERFESDPDEDLRSQGTTNAEAIGFHSGRGVCG